MKNNLDNIEIRSEEVQDILSYVPTWMIRFGNSLIFVVLIILIWFTWFIKYPDIITGEITLTTANPPLKIPTKVSGKINRLFLKDSEIVKQGDFIAEIENPTDKKSIDYLNDLTKSIEFFLNGVNVNLVFNDAGLVFGDAQSEYNALKKKCLDYKNYTSNTFNDSRVKNLEKQVTFHKKLVVIASAEMQFASKEMKNTEEKHNVFKQLYEGKTITKVEFLERENEFTQKQQSFHNLEKTTINYQIAIADYEKQLLTLKEEISRTKRDFVDNIRTSLASIKNFINTWQHSYILSAPIAGKINYLKSIAEKQYISANDLLFAVVPEDQKLIGRARIPSQGYGKIKVNQIVRVKLSDFPFNEYGFIMGRIDKISLISNENIYICDVVLDQGLTTTYRKQLDFKPEMGGTAEVITEDLRLIQRILYTFKNIFN